MSSKKFTLFVLSVLASMLLAIAALVIIVDPLFHYHAPLPFLQYKIDNSMYQNGGILRHFDYNAVIVGTSMSQNFKTSQANELFGKEFVKTPLAGANYIETNELLEQAFQGDHDVDLVIRNIDYSWISDGSDKRYYDGIMPTYLYDHNFFNDVQYWYSRDVLIRIVKDVFLFTLQGNTTTTFDEYNNWSAEYPLGKEYFLSEDTREPELDTVAVLSEESRTAIRESAERNFVQIALDHPDTNFYIFYSPYSTAYWDMLERSKNIDMIIDAKLAVTEALFEAPNITIFSFDGNRELITDLNNYRDHAHYGEHINEDILEWIVQGDYVITEENYKEIIEADRKFFKNYDYDAMYQ